jgi:hypothetical protein
MFSIFQQYTVNGWGQLPFLGTKPSSGSDDDRGQGGGKSKVGAAPRKERGGRGPKVLVGQTDTNARRGRRR